LNDMVTEQDRAQAEKLIMLTGALLEATDRAPTEAELLSLNRAAEVIAEWNRQKVQGQDKM